MSTRPTVTEADIWSRAIQPNVGDLSAEAAREFLRLRLSDSDLAKVRDLSEKSDEGVLTPDEERELDHYLNVGRALEFIKAKARLSLGAAAV